MNKETVAMTPLRFYVSEEARALGVTFDSPRLGDAGFDLRSAESITVEPGTQVALSTGLHLAIPLGWVGIIRERSSTGSKRLYTHSGVIDSSYRGEVKILVSNGGSTS